MMHWGSLENFLQMGGYAPYVWTGYGVTLLLFFANIVMPIHRRKRLIKRLKARAGHESMS